jgi:hypothetical protein
MATGCGREDLVEKLGSRQEFRSCNNTTSEKLIHSLEPVWRLLIKNSGVS